MLLSGVSLILTLSIKLESLLIFPRYHCLFHLLFLPNDYPFIPVWDAVSNLVFFNIKFLQCFLRCLLSLAPLAVLYLAYAKTGTTLFLAHIFTGLVQPKLLHAATVVLNHRTFFISCWTALYLTLCVWPSSATPSLFWTSSWRLPNYWDSAELIRASIPRNGLSKPTTTTTRLSRDCMELSCKQRRGCKELLLALLVQLLPPCCHTLMKKGLLVRGCHITSTSRTPVCWHGI